MRLLDAGAFAAILPVGDSVMSQALNTFDLPDPAQEFAPFFGDCEAMKRAAEIRTLLGQDD